MPLRYKGSYQRVRAYLHKKRTSPRPVVARPPSPRTVAGWILRRPEPFPSPNNCCSNRAHPLPQDRRAHPTRPCLRRHADRAPGRASSGLARRRVRQDDLPSLHTLAAGIDPDRDAVIAGLTLPWSSGAVEGHVNRIKMIKRQMYGRAGFNLLRKRVLLAS